MNISFMHSVFLKLTSVVKGIYPRQMRRAFDTQENEERVHSADHYVSNL